MTLKDIVRSVLVPCYDLASGSLFMFSRADAVENEGYNFKIREVCEATCCDGVEVKSVDLKRKVLAVGGGVAMGSSTAAAITHVLNNKKEFPLAGGVEDLLVILIVSGDVGSAKAGAETGEGEIVRIAAEGVADMVSTTRGAYSLPYCQRVFDLSLRPRAHRSFILFTKQNRGHNSIDIIVTVNNLRFRL